MKVNSQNRLSTTTRVGLLFCLAIALFGQTMFAYAATLVATVDRNRISQNETLTLTVAYDRQVNTSDLKIGSLQNDFEVIAMRPQSNTSVSTVNGKTSKQESTNWVFTLAPKRNGKLSIPAFKLGADQTQLISIEVGSASSANNSHQSLAAKVIVDKTTVYPSQQLLVSIEIHAQNDVSDLNGPQLLIDGAEIEPLGQQNFQRIDNGVATQVVSLKFAVFAQNPGELVIPRMTFQGVKGGRRSLFSNRGQQVIARTEQLKVQVLTQPNSTKTWFPAEQVSIQSNWASSSDAAEQLTARVGEPITRTITIVAKGQRAAVIAPLSHADNNSNNSVYKSYKDQAVLKNQITENGIVSTRIESEAIVPSSEGELILPALHLSWFNVKTAKWQTATLPEEVLVVEPAAAGASAAQNTQTSDITQSNSSLGKQLDIQMGSANQQTLKLWQALCLLLALTTIGQVFYIRKLKQSTVVKANPSNKHQNPSETEAWGNLQKVLKGKHAQSIKIAIMAWVKAVAPKQNAATIHSLIEQIQDSDQQQQIKQQINALDAHLYKQGELDVGDLKVDELEAALKQLRGSFGHAGKESDQDLPPLYAKP